MKSQHKSAISALPAVLVIIIIVLGIVAAYGYVRPISNSGSPTNIITNTITNTVTTTVPSSLIDEAKKEGSMTIYGAVASATFDKDIIPAFTKLYPWAQVSYQSLSAAETVSRVDSEFKAGKVTASVVESSLTVLLPLVTLGDVQNYTNPMVGLMNYTANQADPNGNWVQWYSQVNVILYNTKFVNSSDAPKTLQDLANPKWAGKVAFQNPALLSGAGALFLGVYPQLGNASWFNLMNSIAKNNPIVTPSGGQAYQDVLSGQAYVGVDLADDFLAGIASGNPINGTVTGYETTNALVITKNAPAPALAELFEQWALSPAGQQAITKENVLPAFKPLISQTAYVSIMPSNLTLINGYAFPQFAQNTTYWADTLHNIFG